MSFETITIYRDYQVIDDYVQEPPNLESNKRATTLTDALVSYADSEILQLSGRSGHDVGMGFGQQTMLRFLSDLV